MRDGVRVHELCRFCPGLVRSFCLHSFHIKDFLSRKMMCLITRCSSDDFHLCMLAGLFRHKGWQQAARGDNKNVAHKNCVSSLCVVIPTHPSQHIDNHSRANFEMVFVWKRICSAH